MKKATRKQKKNKSEIGEVLEIVNFMKDHIVTKDEVREIVQEEVREVFKKEGREIVKEEVKEALKPTNTRLEAVESKVDGTNRRLDSEAMARTDLKIPRRVHDLEETVYGKGGSKHPPQIAL